MNPCLRGILGLMVGGLACGLGTAQTPSSTPSEQQIYTCIDAKGRKLTSDRPIMECRDREQTILNPSGTIKGKIGPTLTAQERSVLEEKNKAERAARLRQDEEKKRDRALLIRYPNPMAHEKERATALANVDIVKQAAITRVTQLLKERAKLTDEMAFYQKNPSLAPAKLQRQTGEVNDSLAAQGRFLAEQDREIKRINNRFDEELLRLKPLWGMASATPH